ncbi:MAG: flagellar basal body P-ring protein FlgI [Deferribacteraceae bacterium]|jgi:flagellar P-ring protein precursor FlgI|nr:flagellar basal body P-ring protein FlgI [Deferribacteraceae bacterium]
MKKIFIITFLLALNISANAVVKIKDLANVEGIRENQIFGYGLVVGLNGTGDKDQTKFTTQSLANMLERMGITVNKNDVKVKNIAAVMVTAKLPPFARAGQTIDVTISSVGDAKSLEGGTLLLTPLSAPNGQIYATAQGPISVGGLSASAGGANVTKNHPTAGRIPNGATVEKEIVFAMDSGAFNLFFNKYSLSDVISAKTAINTFMGAEIASVSSPSNITVKVPGELSGSFYDFLNSVLSIEIEPETFAKVILDERTGTIVMGSEVRISTVAVAHGNLTITVTNNIEISQPDAFSMGQTAVTQQPAVEMAEDTAKLMIVPEGVTVSDLVKALNAIGVTPRDLISILQAIKAAGALHAQLEVI